MTQPCCIDEGSKKLQSKFQTFGQGSQGIVKTTNCGGEPCRAAAAYSRGGTYPLAYTASSWMAPVEAMGSLRDWLGTPRRLLNIPFNSVATSAAVGLQGSRGAGLIAGAVEDDLSWGMPLAPSCALPADTTRDNAGHRLPGTSRITAWVPAPLPSNSAHLSRASCCQQRCMRPASGAGQCGGISGRRPCCKTWTMTWMDVSPSCASSPATASHTAGDRTSLA